MTKRIGLSPTAVLTRLKEGRDVWCVSPRILSVYPYPPDYYNEMLDAHGWQGTIRQINIDKQLGYRDFATEAEARAYLDEVKDKLP